MNDFSGAAMALGIIAGLLLFVAGVKLACRSQTRSKGALMILAALVIVMNVMIWTV